MEAFLCRASYDGAALPPSLPPFQSSKEAKDLQADINRLTPLADLEDADLAESTRVALANARKKLGGRRQRSIANIQETQHLVDLISSLEQRLAEEEDEGEGEEDGGDAGPGPGSPGQGPGPGPGAGGVAQAILVSSF
jgi:hypothetical protein